MPKASHLLILNDPMIEKRSRSRRLFGSFPLVMFQLIPTQLTNSHVLYKDKIKDDHSLLHKDRIAPHQIEDSARNSLKTDCLRCAPTGVGVLLSIAPIYMWRITKVDVKSAFLQTGHAQRDVYDVPRPLGESKERGHFR